MTIRQATHEPAILDENDDGFPAVDHSATLRAQDAAFCERMDSLIAHGKARPYGASQLREPWE